jgi:hypothetical protein
MKTELEKKLIKLPDSILQENTIYALFITKVIWDSLDNSQCTWYIDYKDEVDNTILHVEHQSLQAAVDNTLKEIKKL